MYAVLASSMQNELINNEYLELFTFSTHDYVYYNFIRTKHFVYEFYLSFFMDLRILSLKKMEYSFHKVTSVTLRAKETNLLKAVF